MVNSGTGEPQVTQASEERFPRTASERIREHSFPLAVRGYDRQAVDDFVEQVANLVADLESRQTRETVVQRALDEVGEQTAGILQRAHQTADEIAARSRAQADGRLQRAEREAEILRTQADEYAERVIVDTQLLWDERQRLLDDLRRLADDVLATADDAAERVRLPEQLAAPEEEAGALTEQPTTEVELDVLPGGAGRDEPEPNLEEPPVDEPTVEGAALEEPGATEPALEEPGATESALGEEPLDEAAPEGGRYEYEPGPAPGEPEDDREADTQEHPRAGND